MFGKSLQIFLRSFFDHWSNAQLEIEILIYSYKINICDAEGARGATSPPPPIFGRSVNPIPNVEGRLDYNQRINYWLLHKVNQLRIANFDFFRT